MSTAVADDWYARFFTELPNEFWRRAAPPEAARADIDFVEAQLGLPAGAAILDVPCGGHRVTGVDISAEAVTHARHAAADAGLTVTFLRDDMRAVPTDGSFDAARCSATASATSTRPARVRSSPHWRVRSATSATCSPPPVHRHRALR